MQVNLSYCVSGLDLELVISFGLVFYGTKCWPLSCLFCH